MYLCDLARGDLISLLPRGGEIAEIGVAEGTFSAEILRRTAPRRLHLIDPWEHQVRDDDKTDFYGNVSGAEQDARDRAVADRFAQVSRAGQVVVHRAYSLDAAATFDDEQFDWIYVDALHSREAVAAA